MALPFTAPFSTCDAAVLLRAAAATVPAVAHHLRPAPAVHATAEASGPMLDDSTKTTVLEEVAVVMPLRLGQRVTAARRGPASVTRTPLVPLRL